jgi:hypothetical protein
LQGAEYARLTTVRRGEIEPDGDCGIAQAARETGNLPASRRQRHRDGSLTEEERASARQANGRSERDWGIVRARGYALGTERQELLLTQLLA